jgi:hypothetical protein
MPRGHRELFVGTRNELLLVLELVRIDDQNMLRCQCDCGAVKVLHASNFKRTRSCGCIKRRPRKMAHERVGQTFGRLTVDGISRLDGKTFAKCKCVCGNSHTAELRNIIIGATLSCGCLLVEQNLKIDEGAICHHPLHGTFLDMHKRCERSEHPSFANYGGRGIRVCSRWSDFLAFVADMGPRPDGHSIDRRDNDRGYECGVCQECVTAGRKPNCRWVTQATQNRNRSNNVYVEIEGVRQLAQDSAQSLGVTRQAIHLRIKNGWDPVEACTLPKWSSPTLRLAIVKKSG